MVEELKEIETSLAELLKDLETQFSAISLESDTLHKNLINLSSKFPNDKEMIQFIVFINDRLETSHTISRDILYDTVKGILKQKQFLIKRLIKDYDKNVKASESKLMKFMELLKANKVTIIMMAASITITLTLVALFILPSETIEIFKTLKGFTK